MLHARLALRWATPDTTPGNHPARVHALRRWMRGAIRGDDELAMIGRGDTGLVPGVVAELRGRPTT